MVPPKGNDAAVSKLMPGAIMAMAPDAFNTASSACPPIRALVMANTRSPRAKRVTPSPMARTSPAISIPRTAWRGPQKPSARRMSGPKPPGTVPLRMRQSAAVTVLE